MASLRFGTLIPVYFDAVSLPFLLLGLAEVHLSFLVLPLAIILLLWVRELFRSWTPTASGKRRWAPFIAPVLLIVAAGDQALNVRTAYATQRHLPANNQAMADWIVNNTPRHSVVIANFFNYTDVFYALGYYFDPYESVSNNFLGIKKSLVGKGEMNAFLKHNAGLSEIYLLASDHDFLNWQKSHHSPRWGFNSPGKIKRMASFSGRHIHYYADQLRSFDPRNFVSFSGNKNWGTDFYFNNDVVPFSRVVDADYTLYKLTETHPVKSMPVYGATPDIQVLNRQSVGPKKEYNVVRYNGLFYAVPQALRAVDWEGDNVAGKTGVITVQNLEQIEKRLANPYLVADVQKTSSPDPVLLHDSVGPGKRYNVVLYKGLFYAVPQALGEVDWEGGNVAGMTGVITAPTLEKIKHKLSHASVETEIPVLVLESVGRARDLNIVIYKGLYYVLPQKLGAINLDEWHQGAVDKKPGVQTAPTLKEAQRAAFGRRPPDDGK